MFVLCEVGGLTADVHMKVVKKAYRGAQDDDVKGDNYL